MAPKGVASPRSQHSPSTDSPRLVAAHARPRGQRPLPSRRRPGRAGPRPSGDDRVARARAAAERGAVPGAARAARRAARPERTTKTGGRGAPRGDSTRAGLQGPGNHRPSSAKGDVRGSPHVIFRSALATTTEWARRWVGPATEAGSANAPPSTPCAARWKASLQPRKRRPVGCTLSTPGLQV